MGYQVYETRGAALAAARAMRGWIRPRTRRYDNGDSYPGYRRIGWIVVCNDPSTGAERALHEDGFVR